VVDVGKGFFTLAIDMGRLGPKVDDVQRTLFLGKEIEAVRDEFASGG
jgi:hypothetical protein